jgi:signal transduction histidine kinase
VQDDGVGFDTRAPRNPASLGLAGLRERAQLLKGSVAVHSSPGQGTMIEAFIPLGGGGP